MLSTEELIEGIGRSSKPTHIISDWREDVSLESAWRPALHDIQSAFLGKSHTETPGFQVSNKRRAKARTFLTHLMEHRRNYARRESEKLSELHLTYSDRAEHRDSITSCMSQLILSDDAMRKKSNFANAIGNIHHICFLIELECFAFEALFTMKEHGQNTHNLPPAGLSSPSTVRFHSVTAESHDIIYQNRDQSYKWMERWNPQWIRAKHYSREIDALITSGEPLSVVLKEDAHTESPFLWNIIRPSRPDPLSPNEGPLEYDWPLEFLKGGRGPSAPWYIFPPLQEFIANEIFDKTMTSEEKSDHAEWILKEPCLPWSFPFDPALPKVAAFPSPVLKKKPATIGAEDRLLKEVAKRLKETSSKLESAEAELASYRKAKSAIASEDCSVEIHHKPAHEVFEGLPKKVSVPVPVGQWEDGKTPSAIPEIDKNYVFNAETLYPILNGINKQLIPWLQGHTGTGKTTLVEQIYARLQLPLYRLNLDSDITRGELVGRETLVSDGAGGTMTKFVEGIIPKALQEPCGLLIDEIDAMRPDLAFVMQRLAEGNGFTLLEDGGRIVAPHPEFRLYATANTWGRGDESGLYAGTRSLGTAFINRFKPYLSVEYMSEDDECELLSKTSDLPKTKCKLIAQYAQEHRAAFLQANVTLPCSPRDTIAFARTLVDYIPMFGETTAWQLAFKHTILNAADQDDRQTLDSLLSRFVKGDQ